MEWYVRIILVVVGRDNGQLLPTKKSCPGINTSTEYCTDNYVLIAKYCTVRAGQAAVRPCQATHIQYYSTHYLRGGGGTYVEGRVVRTLAKNILGRTYILYSHKIKKCYDIIIILYIILYY